MSHDIFSVCCRQVTAAERRHFMFYKECVTCDVAVARSDHSCKAITLQTAGVHGNCSSGVCSGRTVSMYSVVLSARCRHVKKFAPTCNSGQKHVTLSN